MAETIEADAENHARGMALLGEFSAIVDHANTELAQALKDYRDAGPYEKRLSALGFILSAVANVGHKAGIHGENLMPISDLVAALEEMPHEARNALGRKMWGELKAAKEGSDNAGTLQSGTKDGTSADNKGGAQERRLLRIDFLLREAACHDYLIEKDFTQPEARRSLAKICGHPGPKTVADNYEDIAGQEAVWAKKFRRLYDQNRDTLRRMRGSPEKNVEQFLRLTLLHTPPDVVNRVFSEDAERKKKSRALKEARAERAAAAKRKKRAAAKAEQLQFPSTKSSTPTR